MVGFVYLCIFGGFLCEEIRTDGCFSLKEVIDSGQFTSSTNSIIECFKFFSSFEIYSGYLFLHKDVCICITDPTYRTQQEVIVHESTANCNISCAGNPYYMCGGTSNHGLKYYSVYEVINSFNVTTVGQKCSSANGSAKGALKYEDCQEHLPFICEKYNSSSGLYSYNCTSHARSWYNANRECQEINEQLYSAFDVNKINRSNATSSYWIGEHIEEKIAWGNDKLPKHGRFGCLTLYVDQSRLRYQLSVETCTNTLPSLCSVILDETTDINIGTQMSNYTRIPIALIVAGCVGGVVVVILIIITGIVIKRRRNKSSTTHNKTSTIPTDSDSEPHINNGTPEERHELVNNTEDGVYNHLGDTVVNLKPTEKVYDVMGLDVSGATERRIGLKPTTAIYDVFRHGENEYDVGDASGQRTKLQSSGAIYDIMDHNEQDVGDTSGHRKHTDKIVDLYDFDDTVCIENKT